MDRIKQRYRKLVFFTWFLTLDLIMFGAFVRLTDSGLGCPDWPGCYGSVTPLGAMSDIRQASEAMPFGPVTLSKPWIEMIHRYVGAFLGMLIIAIVVMAWRYRRELGRSPALAVVTLVAVGVQGAFVAWTVTHWLMPGGLTAHLVFGLAVLALMTWLSARECPQAPLSAHARRWSPWLLCGYLLLLVESTLGGRVCTNYATLDCLDSR